MARRICLLLLAFAFGGVHAWAQTSVAFGEIHGRIQDPSGAIVPTATITAINASATISRVLTSSELGQYHFLALPPDFYDIRVEYTGFAPDRKSVV